MSKDSLRSTRLDIRDMPRDRARSLGGLRQALCSSFNYCRRYPEKMKLLKETLKFAYVKIQEWEKEYEAAQERATKRADELRRAEILKLAEEAGIDLDERLGTDKLEDELSVALAAKQAEIEAQAESGASEGDESGAEGDSSVKA